MAISKASKQDCRSPLESAFHTASSSHLCQIVSHLFTSLNQFLQEAHEVGGVETQAETVCWAWAYPGAPPLPEEVRVDKGR